MSGRRDGLLDALCWCGATTVAVTPDAVRAGTTGSCGGDYCNPPPGNPPRRTVWAYLDASPTVTPGGPRGHGPKDKAQPTGRDVQRKLRTATRPPPETHLGHRPEPTGRDRERTARRLAGPPKEAA